MPFESDIHVTRDQGNENIVSRDLTKFCQCLVRHSQMKFIRCLHCGSRMENPTHLATAELFKINVKNLDVDLMIYIRTRCAMPRSMLAPEEYTDDIIRIYSVENHPGYVTLMKEKDNTQLLWSECNVQGKGEGRHGPAVLESHKMYKFDIDYNLSNPTANEAAFQNMVITSQDLVYAVHSPYWPLEAAEWVTRKRFHKVPLTGLIKQIVSYGCDLVPVSHKLCARESNDWRFSFSKAELIIMKSWTMSQRNVYTILWLINKQIEGSNMCTYYFKTLMLWACEEKSTNFWIEDNLLLVNSVCELIIYMMMCLKTKYLPNYFITANNMMDHLIDTDILPDIYALFRAMKTSPINVRLRLGFDVLKSANTTCYELPAWIKRSFIIYNRLNNEEDNFSDLYNSTFHETVSNALHIELSDIHQSLQFQNQSARCNDSSKKEEFYKLAKFNLIRAIMQCKSDKMDTMENCDHIFVRSIKNAFHSQETSDIPISLKRFVNINTKQNSDTFMDILVRHVLNKPSNEKHLISSVETRHYQFIRSFCLAFSEWPGVSPTVNISWFIAKAYLANLYYTTNRKITLAIETCDEIIKVSKDTYKNERFAEKTFPVVLSTQWASIYDNEIQELIGFYSLCKYVLSQSSSRSVYLGVCPVLFALYVKVRTDRHYALVDKTNICNYFAHILGCKYDYKHNSKDERIQSGGQQLLYSVLQILEKSKFRTYDQYHQNKM